MFYATVTQVACSNSFHGKDNADTFNCNEGEEKILEGDSLVM